ncbi:hypothetical protein AGMMS49921_12430 [Endomicrobiia bacterium]|nr:hypothetical protein AGMMS49921_12430 [Endomicrobiia bacterium]
MAKITMNISGCAAAGDDKCELLEGALDGDDNELIVRGGGSSS